MFLFVPAGCSQTPRQQCYEETYCNSADADCLVTTVFLTGLFSSPVTSTNYFYSESEPNDSFTNADYWSAYGTTTMSGSIASASDDDVFYFYNTVSTAASTTFRLSQVSGAATCTAYTRSSFFFDATDPPNIAGGSFTTVGLLTATETSIALLVNHYVFVVCTGSTSQTYSLRLVAPTISYSSFSDSLRSIMMLSCVGASKACKKECDDKHAF